MSICEPAVAEALLAADARDYTATEAKLEATYPVAVIPDDVWDLTAEIRRELALHAAHSAPSVADLVIAATAIRLNLTVLHEDSDVETMARYVPDLKHHRMSKGPGI